MAKTQTLARKRRGYEYDHHYGVTLAGKTVSTTSRASRSTTSARPATATSSKRVAKKR